MEAQMEAANDEEQLSQPSKRLMRGIECLRARNLGDFLQDPDVENLHHEVNWVRTREL